MRVRTSDGSSMVSTARDTRDTLAHQQSRMLEDLAALAPFIDLGARLAGRLWLLVHGRDS